MNVLIIANNTKYAYLFSKFADEVFIIVSDAYSINNRINDELYDYKTTFTPLHSKKNNIVNIFKKIKYYRNFIKKNKVDIVFVNRKDDLIFAKIAARYHKRKIYVLATFHNSYGWVKKRNIKLLSYIVRLYSDGTICLCNAVYKRFLIDNVKENKLLYLPNTLNAAFFNKKNSYAFEDEIKIVYIGRIQRGKNQLLALRLINALKDEYNLKIILAGEIDEKDYYNELENYIALNNLTNNVSFLGTLDNSIIKKDLYKNDIYLTTSIKEMSPYTILEAKAAALPIVCSYAFGQGDLIKDNHDGLLFKDNDFDDALSKLKLLLSDEKLRQKLGENAYLDITSINSPDNASKKLKTFIDNLKK